MEIVELDAKRYPDFLDLMSTNPSADKCQCTWWLQKVTEYHANGPEGNRRVFHEHLTQSAEPMGLLAYDQGHAIGWCALGPRRRFWRAIATPSYRGRDPAEDDRVWLVPCFFVRASHTGQGVTRRLLDHAVVVARAQGALALEGFPFQTGRRPSGDVQVGVQATFEAAGFRVDRTSGSRAVLRYDLRS